MPSQWRLGFHHIHPGGEGDTNMHSLTPILGPVTLAFMWILITKLGAETGGISVLSILQTVGTLGLLL